MPVPDGPGLRHRPDPGGSSGARLFSKSSLALTAIASDSANRSSKREQGGLTTAAPDGGRAKNKLFRGVGERPPRVSRMAFGGHTK